MAIAPAYTSEARIVRLVGQLGTDLRLDDLGDDTAAVQDAVDAGTAELDFYLQRYLQAEIAASEWAQLHATWFAVRFLCRRRLNDVPKSVQDECDERKKQLQLILEGKVPAPRLAHTRRPCAVTGYTADLRRYNNQIRVDKNRSTGVAGDLPRSSDPTSPDNR